MAENIRTLSFFNNKGGVGKTTLSTNVAHRFSQHGARVLYVDCDPQCNATQLLLTEDQWEEIYESDPDPELSRHRSLGRSVYSLFIPLKEGEALIDTAIQTVRSERFQIDVLPGHPQLSQIEDLMSDAWQSALARKTGDFRRIHWAGQLAHAMEVADRYDIIFFDVGPSLGPFNRTVLLGCDAFITPTSTDLFSYHAFGNLARWFGEWTTQYSEISEANLSQWRSYSGDIEEKTRQLRLQGQDDGRSLRYLGYTTLEYVKKKSNGEQQLVGAFERFRGRFEDEAKRISAALGQDPTGPHLIGHIPHMHSMPATAQDVHAPIAGLGNPDGVRGQQHNQRDGYVGNIHKIADIAFERLSHP